MRWWKERYWGFNTRADEEAIYTAGMFRLPGHRLAPRRRDAIARTLAGAGTAKAMFRTDGFVRVSPLVRFPAKRLHAGHYVFAVRLVATMNAARTATFTRTPFRVKPRPVRRRHRH